MSGKHKAHKEENSMVKFTDASGKTTMIYRTEFMRYMRTLWEVAQLNKKECEKSEQEEKEGK